MSAQVPVKPSLAGMTGSEFAAWRGFLRAHAAVVRALDAEMQAAHRLPLTEFEVLLRLSNQPGHRMRLSDLAGSVLLSLSGMSRMVGRLEQAGLVVREPCPGDRRAANAVLTGAGLALAREARVTHLAGVRQHFLRHFSEEDLDTLADLWRRLLGEAHPPEDARSGGAAGDEGWPGGSGCDDR